jgi:hypothetical protein
MLLAKEHCSLVSKELGVETVYLESILAALIHQTSVAETSTWEVKPLTSAFDAKSRVPNRVLECIAAKSPVYGASGNKLENAALCAELALAGTSIVELCAELDPASAAWRRGELYSDFYLFFSLLQVTFQLLSPAQSVLPITFRTFLRACALMPLHMQLLEELILLAVRFFSRYSRIFLC